MAKKKNPKLCYMIKNGQYPISIYQHGPDNFRIQYGLQIKDHLSYADAAKEFGECVFHFLACESKLDNETPKIKCTTCKGNGYVIVHGDVMQDCALCNGFGFARRY